jgi:hypothetical protein
MKDGDLERIARDQAARAKERGEQKRQPNPARAVTSWFGAAMLHGQAGNEFVVILRTKGCCHYYPPGDGCTMCGYNNDSLGYAIDAETILEQFTTEAQKHQDDFAGTGPVVLKIFNSGSFFDDDEIPAAARDKIMEFAASTPAIREIAVESRPEFVTEEKIPPFKAALRDDQRAEVGIGLETWDDTIREDFINKGFTRDQFLSAHEVLRTAGVGTKVYLLLKPPFLSEKAAMDDAVASIGHLYDLGVSTISINPVAIHAGTLVEYLWDKRLYRPPYLWSVMHVLQEAFTMPNRDSNTLIICDPVAGGKLRGAHNCKDPDCNKHALDLIHEAIEAQASVPGLVVDGAPPFPCYLEWLDYLGI